MDKELYIGVDVSKQTLDLAYYDGEDVYKRQTYETVDVNRFSLGDLKVSSLWRFKDGLGSFE